MLLRIATWNINFLHDNWMERIKILNPILQSVINESDIIALQEATLPFSNKIQEMYKFLQSQDIEYSSARFITQEVDFLYKKIQEFFPKNKFNVIKIFEWLMNKLLSLSSWIFSKYGEKIKEMFFKYPVVLIVLSLLCPFILLPFVLFFGMLTIVNKKINGIVQSKFFGTRLFQYTEFKHNGRDAILVNIHLTPVKNEDVNTDKQLKEIRAIHKYIKHKDVTILAGDFNATPKSSIYKYLRKKGYISCVKRAKNQNLPTFPAKNPTKCLDYIWVKGANVVVKDVEIFSNTKATDHCGIKATIDIS